ncbi:MAG: hypothetical protein ABIQ88_15915 [Chitinophagaceae bacterium]
MELTFEENAYVAFMQWFQTTNPDLYFVAWTAIDPGRQGEEVSFLKEKMTVENYQALTEVIKQYYTFAEK